MIRKLTLLLSCAVLFSCNTANNNKAGNAGNTADESKKVNDFLNRRYDEFIARNPESASTLGLKEGNDSWNDRSDEAEDKELNILKATVDSLKKNYNESLLDAQTRLSVRMMQEDLRRAEDAVKWRHYDYEINQMEGVHDDLPAFLINVHKIDSLSDARAYISRLKKLEQVFDQTLANLKKSEAIGVIPPYFTFKYVTDDLKSFIKSLDKKDESNVLLADFTEKVSKLNIDTAQKQAMIAEAAGVLSGTVKSSYQKLLDYWTALEPKAKANGSKGVWSLPNGVDFYAYTLQYHTTTLMTPDQVYDLGISEVARIQKEMHDIMKQVHFKSDSLQDFYRFIKSDPQFKYANNDKGKAELLADANKLIDSMRVKLPDLFATLPKAPLVVKQVEKFREKSAGGAFYEDAAEDGSRPGRYYVNTYNMADEPKYLMEALTYHEAIPGHHVQVTIAQELKGIPKFRRHEGFTAYVEGWGLYAERLGKDAGKYQDPYSDFGRLSMEIFRAARLVVDVGIHYKHWTREQAIAYFVKNTANSQGDIEKEIERYFLWPGQATGYKIGMNKILELREHAKTGLGAQFDIRQFHDVVLTNGAVTLVTLEELVNNWIKEKKSQQHS